VALGEGGQGDDRGLLFQLVQAGKAMARANLQGDLFAVSEGLKNQDTRGNQSPDSKSTVTIDSAAYVS
jgi:hypothetical protein